MRCSQSRSAAIAAAFSLWVLSGVSGFAQSNAGTQREARAAVVALSPGISSSSVRLYVPDLPPSTVEPELPPNLQISRSLRPVVETMLRRSAIFRRQCLRIANAHPRLTVSIGSFHPLPSDRARARTRFLSSEHRLHADVQIAPLEDQVELIAHEIEHVIEQLDGIDLRVHASLRGTAASKCENGSFETVRAVRAGLAVAREADGR